MEYHRTSEDEPELAARKYVNDQLYIMEKYGARPNLTQARREALVQDVLRVTRRLRRKHAKETGEGA